MTYAAQMTDGVIFFVALPPEGQVSLGVGWEGFETMAAAQNRWPDAMLATPSSSSLVDPNISNSNGL